jgi:hypothetical protein
LATEIALFWAKHDPGRRFDHKRASLAGCHAACRIRQCSSARRQRQFEGAEMEFLPPVLRNCGGDQRDAASGNCCQIARSSAVTVSQPNLNMYRPGSVTRPALPSDF